jgi:hypothetical protein
LISVTCVIIQALNLVLSPFHDILVVLTFLDTLFLLCI